MFFFAGGASPRFLIQKRKMTKNKVILEQVELEMDRQERLWGVQNHNPFYWQSVLLEEIGEAAQSINDAYILKDSDKFNSYREELIQAAAVIVQMVASLDRNKDAYIKRFKSNKN